MRRSLDRRSLDCCRGHMVLPLPHTALPPMSIQGSVPSMAYGTNYFLGVTPIHIPPYTWIIHRAWAIFATADAGAGEENYTQVSFQMGETTAALASFGTVDTSATTVGGEPLEVYLKEIPERGRILVVTPSQVGAGGTNLSGAGFAFGVDLLPVR